MGLFGNITRKLFGGSKETSESGNLNRDLINSSFSPWIQQGTQGMGQAAGILGLNGAQANDEALDNWWSSSGGNFLMDQGLDQVDAMFRSRGLANSGAAMKGMEDYRSGLASTKLNEYMGNLFNLNQQALGAGGLVTQAGQYSKGKETKDTGGLGKAIGTGLALLGFSDPRVKTDIKRIGEYPDGLGIYRFRYLGAGDTSQGVMADEVAELRPWALGPEIGGFATVNYGAL